MGGSFSHSGIRSILRFFPVIRSQPGRRFSCGWKTCFSRRSLHVTGEAHQSLPVNWNDHAWAVGLCALGALPANAATRGAAKLPLGGVLRLCDIWKLRRARFLLVVATAAVISLFASSNVSATEPKRVLLIHSFSNAAPPFTVESTAFESELVAKLSERVDLDEVSLDMARYAGSEMQEAMLDYLQKRQAKWQPDLVVPIGSPAAIFVANYRDRLFPKTPVHLYLTRPTATSTGCVGEERGLCRTGI